MNDAVQTAFPIRRRCPGSMSTTRFGTRMRSSTSSTSSRSSIRMTTESAIFQGLTSKLGYIRDLGVNTIWLMPFYPSPLKDDGYDIADYQQRSSAIRHARRFPRHAARGASARPQGGDRTRSSITPPISIPGSRPRAARRRARPSGTSMSGATPIRNISARESSSSIPRHPTGPGIRSPRPTTGTASSAISPI